MKHLASLFLLAALPLAALAQPPAGDRFDLPAGDGAVVCPRTADEPAMPESVRSCGLAERLPEFRGDLNTYINAQLRYPDSARDAGYEGRVTIGFTVDTSGLLQDLRVLQSSGYAALDGEALRIFAPMRDTPHWKPGELLGKRIPVFYRLPLTFRLE